ncbi:hypothetical protein HK405_004406 [Cladochytrium tenue]|nr:hypothetical protein HK405_004406 [Cladochytrium tenue]
MLLLPDGSFSKVGRVGIYGEFSEDVPGGSSDKPYLLSFNKDGSDEPKDQGFPFHAFCSEVLKSGLKRRGLTPTDLFALLAGRNIEADVPPKAHAVAEDSEVLRPPPPPWNGIQTFSFLRPDREGVFNAQQNFFQLPLRALWTLAPPLPGVLTHDALPTNGDGDGPDDGSSSQEFDPDALVGQNSTSNMRQLWSGACRRAVTKGVTDVAVNTALDDLPVTMSHRQLPRDVAVRLAGLLVEGEAGDEALAALSLFATCRAWRGVGTETFWLRHCVCMARLLSTAVTSATPHSDWVIQLASGYPTASNLNNSESPGSSVVDWRSLWFSNELKSFRRVLRQSRWLLNEAAMMCGKPRQPIRMDEQDLYDDVYLLACLYGDKDRLYTFALRRFRQCLGGEEMTEEQWDRFEAMLERTYVEKFGCSKDQVRDLLG